MTRKKLLFPYILISPSIIFASFIIIYPVFDLVNLSLNKVNRFGKLRGFNEGANFISILSDQLFYDSLYRTFIWTFGVVVGTIIISIPIAIILNEKFIGRGIARTIIMLPWAISLAMSSVVWRWALDGEFGMFNHTLKQLNLIEDNIFWLATGDVAFPIQILIGILVSIPFTTTVFLGGLSSVPLEIYDSGKMDGTNKLSEFLYITYPLIKPFINIAIVINLINVFNSFPIIWVLTEGGPANSTDILITYLYKLAFKFGKIGNASALSLIMFLILIILVVIYIKVQIKHDE
jgi:multiple sugar transport system permease protein